MNIAICLPVHWVGLARREAIAPPDPSPAAGGKRAVAAATLEGTSRTIAMALFSLIVAASAVVFGALAVHLVPILQATGLAAARPCCSPR
jgi:hypothetical protein